MEQQQAGSEKVTARTWTVVFLMSMSWALSFYPILIFQAIEEVVAKELGQVRHITEERSYH